MTFVNEKEEGLAELVFARPSVREVPREVPSSIRKCDLKSFF